MDHHITPPPNPLFNVQTHSRAQGNGRLEIVGTYEYSTSGSTGQAIEAPTNITGTINAKSGIMEFTGEVAGTGCTVNAASGATMMFGVNKGIAFDAATTFDVEGTVAVDGSVTIEGADTTIATLSIGNSGTLLQNGAAKVTTLEINNGGVLSGTGDIAVDTLEFTAGTIAGSGTLTVTTADFVQNSAWGLTGRTLLVKTKADLYTGTMTFDSGATLEFASGSTATFAPTGNTPASQQLGLLMSDKSSKIVLDGTMSVSNGGFNVGVGATISGIVSIGSKGYMSTTSDLTVSGNITMAEGTSLKVTGSTTFTKTSALTGADGAPAGSLVNLASLITFEGVVSVASLTMKNGGCDFNGPRSVVTTLNMDTGSADIGGTMPVTVGTLVWSSGDITNTANVTVTKLLNQTSTSGVSMDAATIFIEADADFSKASIFLTHRSQVCVGGGVGWRCNDKRLPWVQSRRCDCVHVSLNGCCLIVLSPFPRLSELS